MESGYSVAISYHTDLAVLRLQSLHRRLRLGGSLPSLRLEAAAAAGAPV